MNDPAVRREAGGRTGLRARVGSLSGRLPARRDLLLVVAVALAVRAVVMIDAAGYVPLFDSGDYARHAVSIASGHGFPESVFTIDGGPSAFRPPLYPYLLGLVYAVSGDSVTAGLLLNLLLGVLGVSLVQVIGFRLWGRETALIAGLLAACLPSLAILHSALLTEPLFIVLLLALTLLIIEMSESGAGTGLLLAAGATCALAALTRSNGILLVLPLALAAWSYAPGGPRRRIGAVAVALAGALLVSAPWLVRNAIEFDRPMGISTQAGFGLAGTYNQGKTSPGFRYEWVNPALEGRYVEIFREPGLDEADLDARLRSEAGAEIHRDPGFAVTVSARNVLRSFSLVGNDITVREAGGSVVSDLALDSERLGTWMLLPLASLGALLLISGRVRPPGPWQIWLIPVLAVLSAVPITGGSRYRVPADPFLILLAAVAACFLAGLLAQRRSTGAGSPAGA